jgi:glycine dehydrogenase subunit 1
MPYVYHTDEDEREMLRALGLQSVEELFTRIPKEFLIRDLLPIGVGKAEHETIKYLESLAAKNREAGGMTSFLGGGVYDHVVPAVIKHLAGRSEFATAYTPYQAEVSQGTLQVIFEFQTLISRLTGMPVANASMYDGATALAEAALMAAKITGRTELLVPDNINPRYRNVLGVYTRGQSLVLRPIPVTADGDIDAGALRGALSDNVAGVLVQNPNYFGILERPWEYGEHVKKAGALLVAGVDPVSLSIFQAPGDYSADIAVGEGQSLGNDMNYGGPLLGFMSSRAEYIRNLPGRLVSETQDIDGKRAYVLTLQTREQHIRREKATSNICTNQGLLAIRAAIYLSMLGETGFRELGRICHDKAHRLAEMISACPGYSLRYAGPFFREFVVRCPRSAQHTVDRARDEGILAGIPLGKYFGREAEHDLLVAVTEKRSDDDFERFTRFLKTV